MTPPADVAGRPDTWMQTASGRGFDLLAPDPDMVCAEDLAEHLAKANRYAGGTCGAPYSVAQHSVIVADALPPTLRIWGLLHDGHEYVLGDDIRPKIKALVAIDPAAGRALYELRWRADAAIHKAFGLPFPPPPAVVTVIRGADLRACATERRDLMAPAPRPWVPLPHPFPHAIRAWPWPKAAEIFLERLRMFAPTIPKAA